MTPRVVRLKNVADVLVSNIDKHSVAGEQPVKLCNYVDVYKNTYISSAIQFMESTASDDQIRRYKLRVGDVIITKDSETPFDIAVPALVTEDVPGLVCGYHLAIIRARTSEVEARFLLRVFQAKPTAMYFATSANGITRYGLTYYGLKSAPIPLPPLAKQKDIADFLDRETAEADALVAKYERLIELLEEKRVALITQAVTKGLDPKVPMKDSGIPYIGEIPSHWGTPSVWMQFSLGRGRVLSHEDIRNNPGDYPVYSSQTENNGEMGRIGTFDFDGNYLTWTTDGANAGTVFVRNGRFSCTNVCGTLKARLPSTNLTYYQKLLAILTKAHVRQDINPKLMNDVMARIRILTPPSEEQLAIQCYLKKQLRPIEVIKEKLLVSLDLVREHRSALITAAVTGQIDVTTYRSKKRLPIEVSA